MRWCAFSPLDAHLKLLKLAVHQALFCITFQTVIRSGHEKRAGSVGAWWNLFLPVFVRLGITQTTFSYPSSLFRTFISINVVSMTLTWNKKHIACHKTQAALWAFCWAVLVTKVWKVSAATVKVENTPGFYYLHVVQLVIIVTPSSLYLVAASGADVAIIITLLVAATSKIVQFLLPLPSLC